MLLLFRVMTLLPGLLTVAPGWTVTVRPSCAPASKPVAEGPLQVTEVPVWMQSASAGVAVPMQKTIQAPSRAAPRRRIPPDKPNVQKAPAPISFMHLVRRKIEAQAKVVVRI